MPTTAIIHFIEGLTLEEQQFVFEQMLKLRQENKQKQAKISSDFVKIKEIASTSGIDVDEAFDNCFALLSNLYGVEKSIFGVPQTIEQLKSSVKSAEKQYEMGLGKSNEEIFNKYEKWL